MKIAIKLDNYAYSIDQLKEIVAQDTLNLCDKPELKAWLTSQRMIQSCSVNQSVVRLIPQQRSIVLHRLNNFEDTAKSLKI